LYFIVIANKKSTISFLFSANPYTFFVFIFTLEKNMKHNGFEIKVSDILNSKVTDTITFENKMIPELENLSEK
jgi:hypothetical protein